MKTWRIKGENYQQDVDIIADAVIASVGYTVEIHNRDYPDDPWVAGELPEKIQKEVKK
jgi:hypothetical protein